MPRFPAPIRNARLTPLYPRLVSIPRTRSERTNPTRRRPTAAMLSRSFRTSVGSRERSRPTMAQETSCAPEVWRSRKYR